MVIVRQSDDGEYIEVWDTPSEVDIWKINQRNLGRVLVQSAALAGRMSSLAWLSKISVQELTVYGEGRRIPAIPPDVVRNLVRISLLGRIASRLSTADLRNIERMVVDSDHLDGPLAKAANLRELVLGKVQGGSLELISGCGELRTVALEMARGTAVSEFDLSCAVPPPMLTSLEIDGAGLVSLAGIGAFPRLRHLMVQPKGGSIPDQRIDLRPLRGCPSLEIVVIDMNGTLEHAEILADLKYLQRFTAVRGRLEPELPPAPWLSF